MESLIFHSVIWNPPWSVSVPPREEEPKMLFHPSWSRQAGLASSPVSGETRSHMSCGFTSDLDCDVWWRRAAPFSQLEKVPRRCCSGRNPCVLMDNVDFHFGPIASASNRMGSQTEPVVIFEEVLIRLKSFSWWWKVSPSCSQLMPTL